ncbi:hypothetical protein DVR14_24755 (plasmid) [Natrinema thermotolerans]|nr:hypothetical protein DVR14_24755 [Natrinema thermotolerans]
MENVGTSKLLLETLFDQFDRSFESLFGREFEDILHEIVDEGLWIVDRSRGNGLELLKEEEQWLGRIN